MRIASLAAVIICVLAVAPAFGAKEDIEFVAEHLAEVPMDNRYATLPLWRDSHDTRAPSTHVELQGAYSELGSGNLSVRGPMFSLGVRRGVSDRWSVGGFVFQDPLQLRSSREDRPLQTLFAPSTPFDRPVDARFSNLDGTLVDSGVGLFAMQQRRGKHLGEYAWVAGALWQRVKLRDFRLDYELTSGPSIGTAGQIDFDATYSHIVPFIGIEIPRQWGLWAATAHALYAMPLPRRGVAGHITGPGFDIYGDTQDVGAGKHFGDPSLTLGLSLTYLPAHLSFEAGALVTQALFEGVIHRGIDHDYLVSVSWKW